MDTLHQEEQYCMQQKYATRPSFKCGCFISECRFKDQWLHEIFVFRSLYKTTAKFITSCHFWISKIILKYFPLQDLIPSLAVLFMSMYVNTDYGGLGTQELPCWMRPVAHVVQNPVFNSGPLRERCKIPYSVTLCPQRKFPSNCQQLKFAFSPEV